MLKLKIEKEDAKSLARVCEITLNNKTIQTPVFMPVGTNATIKGLTAAQIKDTGSQIILANTYHLYLSPGTSILEKFDGVKKFMGWDGLMLTDSGGFQVFSLPNKVIEEEGVTFKNPHTKETIQFTPELAIQVQETIGADIIMSFDECIPYPTNHHYAKEAVERVSRWAWRGKQAHKRTDQALFGIVQGSIYPDLREKSADDLVQMNFPGYAIGGVSVGEGHDLMMQQISMTVHSLPKDKPRYLMGVGLPEDIIGAVERGMDMFDCVIPSRYARSASLFTRRGKIRITNNKYKKDQYPIDTACRCYTCTHVSRAYLYHLYKSGEVLATTLGTIHNIQFYQDLMRDIRFSIMGDTFKNFKMKFLQEYRTLDGKDDKK